jgi:segregation and condensation protein A
MAADQQTYEGSPLQEMPVHLDSFAGPLDLLLHLIRESKVDILDIPVSVITEQYLQYLDVMRTLNLEIAGEFLVVAATLLHIKSRMLLPVDDEEGAEQGEDPRRELVQQLIEYQKFKGAGQLLRSLEERRSRVFTRESLGPAEEPRRDYPLEVSIFDLIAAMRRVIEQLPKTDRVEIEPDRLSVAERIAEILEALAPGAEVAFEDLFRGSEDTADVIVTFLAILEMVRLRLVRVWQAVAYGAIRVAGIQGTGEGEGNAHV